jgi:hypothetical protein
MFWRKWFVPQPLDTEALTRRIVEAVLKVDIATLKRLTSKNLTNSLIFPGRLDQRDGLLQFARGLHQ